MENEKSTKFAVIRIRSLISASSQVKDTMKMLNLGKSNACAIVDATPSMRGMLTKVKDFATFGPVSDATLKALKDKKGESKVFFLAPPRGGFERKGIKRPYRLGGVIGLRDNMDDLIMRML